MGFAEGGGLPGRLPFWFAGRGWMTPRPPEGAGFHVKQALARP